MATRLHFVKKARKKNPVAKKGESYYWWKFNFGTKQYSKDKPPRSRLTKSEFLGTIYDLEDRFNAIQSEASSRDECEGIANDLEDIANELEQLGSEQEDKRSNMPEQLQDGESGQLLETRAQNCNDIAEACNEAAAAIRELEPETDDGEGWDSESLEDGTTVDVQAELDNVSWEYE